MSRNVKRGKTGSNWLLSISRHPFCNFQGILNQVKKELRSLKIRSAKMWSKAGRNEQWFWRTWQFHLHIINKKGKVVLLHSMKAYRRSRGIAPLILNLGAIWRRVVNFTPRPHSRTGRFSGTENLLRLPRFEPRTVQLYRLRYPRLLLRNSTLKMEAPDPWEKFLSTYLPNYMEFYPRTPKVIFRTVEHHIVDTYVCCLFRFVYVCLLRLPVLILWHPFVC
jgi:hypothetical protein